MAYVYINKKTKKVRVFGGLKVLCKETGIKPDNLYTVFSRKKLKKFENDNYSIFKTNLERGGVDKK